MTAIGYRWARSAVVGMPERSSLTWGPLLGDGDGLADGLADVLGVASAEGAIDAGAETSGEGTAATAGGVDPPPDART